MTSNFVRVALGRMMESGTAKKMNAPLTVTAPIAACEAARPPGYPAGTPTGPLLSDPRHKS